MLTLHRGLCGVLLLGGVGCGTGDDAAEDEAIAPEVEITAPAVGETVIGAVMVRLAVRGVEVRPAGVEEPNSGHHHLFVDRDIVAVGDTIPAGPGIIHLGAGQTEHEVSLEPGGHTIIAVMGDHAHARLADVKTDTVTIVVN